MPMEISWFNGTWCHSSKIPPLKWHFKWHGFHEMNLPKEKHDPFHCCFQGGKITYPRKPTNDKLEKYTFIWTCISYEELGDFPIASHVILLEVYFMFPSPDVTWATKITLLLSIKLVSCLMTGSLFHGLWNNHLKNWVLFRVIDML